MKKIAKIQRFINSRINSKSYVRPFPCTFINGIKKVFQTFRHCHFNKYILQQSKHLQKLSHVWYETTFTNDPSIERIAHVEKAHVKNSSCRERCQNVYQCHYTTL